MGICIVVSTCFCLLASDRVFGPTTTTRHVYDVAAQHVVSSAMEGVNGNYLCFFIIYTHFYQLCRNWTASNYWSVKVWMIITLLKRFDLFGWITYIFHKFTFDSLCAFSNYAVYGLKTHYQKFCPEMNNLCECNCFSLCI